MTPKNHLVSSCPQIIINIKSRDSPPNAILMKSILSKAKVGISLNTFLTQRFLSFVHFLSLENKMASKFSVIINEIQDAIVIRTVDPKKFSQYFLKK